MAQYKSFPPLDEIYRRLEAMDGYRPDRSALYGQIAERLAGKTFDNAAFALLLIELLHRHDGPEVDDLADFLPRCILTLSGDDELADSARQAFRELGPGDDKM